MLLKLTYMLIAVRNILLISKYDFFLPGFRAILVSRTSPNSEKAFVRSSSEHFDRTHKKLGIEDGHMVAIIFWCSLIPPQEDKERHTLKLIFLIMSLDFSALFRIPLNVASSSFGV